MLMSLLSFVAPVIPQNAMITSMTESLGSVTGIVALTLISVEIIKRALGNVSWVGRVPTWAIAVGVSATITAGAHYGLGLLEGNFGELLWQVVVSAATASGIYSWLRNPDRSPADRKLEISSQE